MSKGKIFSIGKRFLTQQFLLEKQRQVSLYLTDLEMNWTSSFLVQSDNLAIVLHLLLAPVATVVKPAEHEVAHGLSPSPGAVSRCFPQNRRSTLCSVGGRTLLVSGEVHVILVFSKLLGLTTCEGSGLCQSATQMCRGPPQDFCSLRGGCRTREQDSVEDKKGVKVLGVVK